MLLMPELALAGGAWLVLFLAAQRLAELALAQANTARLRAAGAREFGAAHYPVMVALHGCWLAALWLLGHDRPVSLPWLAVFVVLQAARIWVIVTLGRRWTTRVLVRPGAAPVVAGPYRWLRHPNYAVVALEIAVVPLALGLPLVALIFTAANAAMLWWRIGVENAALAWAEGTAGQRHGKNPPTLANAGPRR
jgi:methyltransferase